MTDPATMAVENAYHFEAKKTGFGQAQDGWSLTLRIQDIDVPEAVSKARKGTRYMVALVELGDDELPVQRREEPTKDDTPQPRSAPHPIPSTQPGGVSRKWDELPAAQQAGIRCEEPAFAAYIAKHWPRWVEANEKPADFVRWYCGVSSRSNIDKNMHSLEAWRSLDESYLAWMREAEHVPA